MNEKGITYITVTLSVRFFEKRSQNISPKGIFQDKKEAI